MDTEKAPIKKCDYCEESGVMPTFVDGETICKACLLRLPISGRFARKRIIELELQLEAMKSGKMQ